MATRPPRTRRRALGDSFSRSTSPPPSSASRMLPAVTRPGGGTRPSTARAVRVFPEPDSPTSPTTSPRPTVSETPRTTDRRPSPSRTGKATSRSRIARRASATVLSGQAAQPADRRGDAEAGSAGVRPAVAVLDVGDAGDVEVSPAPHAARELREEGRGGARAPLPPGGVAEVGVRPLHGLQKFGEEGEAPEALASRLAGGRQLAGQTVVGSEHPGRHQAQRHDHAAGQGGEFDDRFGPLLG